MSASSWLLLGLVSVVEELTMALFSRLVPGSISASVNPVMVIAQVAAGAKVSRLQVTTPLLWVQPGEASSKVTLNGSVSVTTISWA